MGADLVGNGTSTPLIGLVANALLLAGSFWIARCGLHQPRGLPAWLATAVVFWTVCTLGFEIQGALDVVSLGAIAVQAVFVFGIGALARWLRPPVDREPEVQAPSNGAGWDALAGLALLLSAALVLGMRSLLLAVKVVSDGPIYHLYFAARWWKAGRLILIATPFGESAATYFPANGDLWFTWLMASWGGERLAKVGQAPFWVLASLAAYGCARLLGAGRSASLVATDWFASSTPFLIYSFEPNVDTIFVAGIMLAAYFFLRFVRGDLDIAALGLGALAAGLALGTKPTGVVFVPPLIALVIAAIFVRSERVLTKVALALLTGLLPLVTGGYWFFRNAALLGNPIYPLEIRLFGHTILDGWYGPDAMRYSHYYVPFHDWRALGDISLAVLDPRLAPVWIASLAAGWVLSRERNAGARTWIGIFSLMAVLNVAFYWVFIPYRTQQRFMLQALGFAVVPLAITLDRAPWLRRIAAGLLGLHLLTPQAWPLAVREEAIPWDLSRLIPNAVGAPMPLFPRLEQVYRAGASSGSILSLGLLLAVGLAAALMVWAWNRFSTERTRRMYTVIIAISASGLFLFLGALDLWIIGIDPRVRFYPPFADFYIGWLNFDAWAGPRGSRVAYAGTNLPYYLLGTGLRNEVSYININRHRDWLLHDYHREARQRGEGSWPNSRPGWDREDHDVSAWLVNLEAAGIQLLVVTRVNRDEGMHNVADSGGFPLERSWAESLPERFEPLYGVKESDPCFRLFRVRARESVP